MNEYNAVIEKLDMLSNLGLVEFMDYFGNPERICAWNSYAKSVLSSNPDGRQVLYISDDLHHEAFNGWSMELFNQRKLL